MTALRALLYADWRAFVNDVRIGLRSPLRVTIWVCYALAVILFAASRARTGHGPAGTGAFSDRRRADYLICAQVFGLALALAFGARRIGLFRTLAEARFIIGGIVPAPIAIAYLQARESAVSAARRLSSLFYIAFVAAPRHLSPLAVVMDLLVVAALFGATSAIALPRKLAPEPWPIVCRILGIALGVLALVPVVRDLSYWSVVPHAVARPLRHLLPAVHPGVIFVTPNVAWLLVPMSIGALAIAAVAVGGRDRYPELYALSLARIDGASYLAMRRKRTRDALSKRATIRVDVPAPSGSLVIVWKSIVGFRRSVSLRTLALGAAFWLVVGFAGARASAAFFPLVAALLWPLAVVTVFVLSLFATTSLAAELRRPIFWLCDISLFERLAALVLARNWRLLLTSELLTAGIAIGGGSPLVIYACGVLLPALIVLVGTIGFAVYSFVPTSPGVGGPEAGVRLFVSGALLVPVGAAAALGAIVGVPFAAAIGTLVLISEAVALVGLSAWRLDGRIDRLVM